MPNFQLAVINLSRGFENKIVVSTRVAGRYFSKNGLKITDRFGLFGLVKVWMTKEFPIRITGHDRDGGRAKVKTRRISALKRTILSSNSGRFGLGQAVLRMFPAILLVVLWS